MPQTPASSFAIATLDASKVEDPRGVTPYTFTVTRTGDTSTAAVLSYAVSGSGANPATAADFPGSAFPDGTVSFAPGDASQTITVPVQGSPAARPNEGLTVTLSAAPAGTAITGAAADGLIRTDDADTTPAAFVAKFAPKSSFNSSTALGPVSSDLLKKAGASGTVAVSSTASGPFRTPVLGIGNAVVATAPAAGSTLTLLVGYDALVAGGANPVTLADGGAFDAVLVGNGAGDTFNSNAASTGAGAVLIGGAGNDVFSVSGNAKIDTGGGQDTVFAMAPATLGIYESGGSYTAVLAGGNATLSGSGLATIFCGAADASIYDGSIKATVVGGDGRLTYRNVFSDSTVFGGKGGLTYGGGGIFGNNTVVGGSGAISVDADGQTGSYWGYSGQDVIFSSALYSNLVAGVSGDKLSISGSVFNIFVSLTGGVVMDGSHTAGQTTFFGGSTGTDTIIAGGDPKASRDSTVIVTGSNTSTVQLGGGKATVFANGSSTITSGAGSADLVFDDRTQFLLNAAAPSSTRVFALFNFVPGTEHISLQNYGSDAAAYALLNQVNAPGFTQLTLPDQTRILLIGTARADASVFA